MCMSQIISGARMLFGIDFQLHCRWTISQISERSGDCNNQSHEFAISQDETVIGYILKQGNE